MWCTGIAIGWVSKKRKKKQYCFIYWMRKGAYRLKKWLLNENVSIEWKKYLLNENMIIDWKCVYWMKICLLIENVSIEWKYAYW